MRTAQRDRIAGQVSNASVAVAGGENFSVVSGGTGIAQVYLPSNFRLLGLSVTAVNPSAAIVVTEQLSGNSFVVRTFSLAGTAAGVPWTFTAVGRG
jgi:hypothetical protein